MHVNIELRESFLRCMMERLAFYAVQDNRCTLRIAAT